MASWATRQRSMRCSCCARADRYLGNVPHTYVARVLNLLVGTASSLCAASQLCIAMDATRALLDELMGRERNVPLSERSNRRLRYDDPIVCKYDMGGLCPHGLFKNTRSDLGPCEYDVHSDHLDWEEIKADYDQQDVKEKERYERRLMRYLEDLIREMDRKIGKCKDRAEKESAPKPIKAEDQAKLDDLQSRAKECVVKSQRMGEEGDVDGAMLMTQQAETYKKQHEDLFRRLTTPDRTMTVCEICGVFINSTDNEERRQDHLNGKQYLGWKAIREHYAKLQERFSYPGTSGSAPPEGEKPESRSREDRDRDRERERSPRRDERYSDDRRRDDRYRDERYRDDRVHHRDERYGRGDDRHHRRGGGYERGGYDRAGYDRGGYDRHADYGREVAPPHDLYPRGSSYPGGGRDRHYEDRRRY